MMKMIVLTTSGSNPLTRLLPVFNDLTVASVRATAATLMIDASKAFKLRYMDSDGDEVTIARDADVKELIRYMADEQMENVTVLVVPHEPAASHRAASALQTQLWSFPKLTSIRFKEPTLADAVNLLIANLKAMDVAEDSKELAVIKQQLQSVLEDEEVRKVVEEMCASEELKELAEVLCMAIYKNDASVIEETITARLVELLVFAQRLVSRCPMLKRTMVTVMKKCMNGLVRLDDLELADDEVESSRRCSNETLDRAMYVHSGVFCDGCTKSPVVGVRYKSLESPDFDLCEDCEASGKWVNLEPFIKITHPSRGLKDQKASTVHSLVVCDGCERSPIVGSRFKSMMVRDFDLCAACEMSGKWKESHGPFTRIQEPRMIHAVSFPCRREGKYGHHGSFHGKSGKHDGYFGKISEYGPPGISFRCPQSLNRRHETSAFFKGLDSERGRPHGEGMSFGLRGYGPPLFGSKCDSHGPSARPLDGNEE